MVNMVPLLSRRRFIFLSSSWKGGWRRQTLSNNNNVHQGDKTYRYVYRVYTELRDREKERDRNFWFYTILLRTSSWFEKDLKQRQSFPVKSGAKVKWDWSFQNVELIDCQGSRLWFQNKSGSRNNIKNTTQDVNPMNTIHFQQPRGNVEDFVDKFLLHRIYLMRSKLGFFHLFGTLFQFYPVYSYQNTR